MSVEQHGPAEVSGANQRASAVEDLRDRLVGLVREREELRAAGAGRSELERNRQGIVGAQWELSRALVARHHPGPPRPGFQPA